jgi:hypothetical protein
MTYLVKYPDCAPFFTNWFDEGNYEDGMLVVRLAGGEYYNGLTTRFIGGEYYNGKEWIEIEEDSL